MKQQYLQSYRQTPLKNDYLLDSKSTTANERRMEKCISATEFSFNHRHRNDRVHEMHEPYFQRQESRNNINKEKQLGQFMFCLKLKMISIAGIFDGLDLTTQVIEKKDAKELLDELARKIKNFQKESAKKLQQMQVKCKSLQIQLINVESQRKSLQYQSSHSRKQIQRSSKTSEIEIKKMEAKIKLQQNQKQIVESKLMQKTHVVEQLNKKIAELQAKSKESLKLKKDFNSIILEKDKQIIKLEGQVKEKGLKKQQETESLKTSLMKKVEQNNKLNVELRQLRQQLDRKEVKIGEQRRNYNLLYAEMEKANCQMSSLHEQVFSLRTKLQNNTKCLQSLTTKQSSVNSSVLGFTKSSQQIQNKLQQLTNSYTNLLSGQQKFHKQVVQINNHIAEQMQKLDQMYKRREILLEQEKSIQIREKVKQEQRKWRDRVGQLQQLVQELHCRLDMQPVSKVNIR